jgi:hypothetical protein
MIKKIAFLVKMAKIVSFRPNHKIFSGFVARSGKRSKLTKIIGRGARGGSGPKSWGEGRMG